MSGAAPSLILDHIGIAVRSINESIERWTTVFGYRQATEVVLNTRQQVRVVFLERAGSLAIKLVEPADPASPIAAFVRRGGGLHHLCFRAPSVEAEVARLEALGSRVVSPPEPGEAFGDELISFLYVGDGITIELIDTDRRARRLFEQDSADSTDGAA